METNNNSSGSGSGSSRNYESLNKISFSGGSNSSSGENSPHRNNRSPLKHPIASSVLSEPYVKPPYSKFKPCSTFDPNSVPILPSNKARQTEGIGRVSRRPSLLLNKQHTSKLKYSIHSWSSHSSCFYPENILIDNPNDQSSRWSTGNNNLTQFIMLELEQVSVVQTITFGKYNKVHVCNLKEFKVYGGLTPNDMVELLHNGLRNNHHPETFSLKFSFKNVLFPCKYIKIVPLLAWGANFNYSIWYVELQGNCDNSTTEQVYKQYAEYRENEVIRLCLKYFRQRNFTDAFQALSNHTGLELECPMLSQLNRLVVEEGKFDEAEQLICLAGERNYFDDWIASCDSTPSWRRVMATDATGHSPCMRGGHQMCIDSENGIIYLMGGWDGYRDLGDFWKFNISSQTWTKISSDTSEQNGPGARSCHKICIDPVKKRIYVLGKYVDTEARANIHLDSDFFYYDIMENQWVKLSNDVSGQNGPDLIFDHQMCFDSDQQVLYVFGGKAIRPEPNTHVYSGLYSYNLATDTWKCLRSDDCSDDDSSFLKGRIGHSMMLDTIERKLYIIAGQRNKDYLSDFYVYDLDTDQVTERQRDYSILGGPDAGFTQRANIDSESRQFFVFSGLMKERTGTRDTVKNVFWSFNLDTDAWNKVYENNNVDPQYWSRMSELEPCPRFAHQMVLDTVNKVHYLFGGNPGETGNTHLRLDDFWELKLIRPSLKEIIRKARLLIRKHKYLELCCCTDPLSPDPLEYLRSEVSELVDHSNEEESREFRCLASHLFSNRDQVNHNSEDDYQIIWDKFKCLYETPNSSTSVQPLFNTSFTNFQSVDLDPNQVKFFQPRMVLYDKLLEIFPDNMKQPSLNLIDLVNVS